jgi:hypothetical protein
VDEGEDIPWDRLVNEDVDSSLQQLAGEDADPSFEDLSLQAQGPFPFHGEENAASRLTEMGRAAPFEPPELRDNSKWQRTNEAQPESGGPTPKRLRPVASR